MPKNPLFSTYRAGENRVTASILAVFERIDFGLVERLLTAASGEASLPFVSFENQIATRDHAGVPDAGISANFRYLFEVKTTPYAIDDKQLERHLRRLDNSFDAERLFVLTPDPEEPPAFERLRQPKLIWLNFQGLDQAIDEALHDESEMIAEQARFLLYELRALFEQERLLGQEDVVIVAARHAYPEYRDIGAYICQPGRSFRDGLKRMGFYYGGAIQPEIPAIRYRRDNVIFSSENTADLRHQGNAMDAELATLIERLTADGLRTSGQPYQVFLLSPADDAETLHLAHPIRNTKVDRKGNPWAWTLGQGYARSTVLERNPPTTSELEAWSP
jgi:hypothetical protein